jgi:hypothetical protein
VDAVNCMEQITPVEILPQHVDTGEIGACQAHPGHGIEARSDHRRHVVFRQKERREPSRVLTKVCHRETRKREQNEHSRDTMLTIRLCLMR